MKRLVLITKRTRLAALVAAHHTFGAANFCLERQGQSIAAFESEDFIYQRAVQTIRQHVPADIPMVETERADLPNFLFRETDTVIICGPDGLFANAASFLGNQPVITVNPDPEHVAGILMLFPATKVGELLRTIRDGNERSELLPLAEACITGGPTIVGINDIFIGRNDHVSARYEIQHRAKKERQSSSGIIVSTGLGSTGWLRSIRAMVEAIAPGKEHTLCAPPKATDRELLFVVREPFPSPATGATIVTGRITPGNPLTVISEMPAGGCIFSDGITERPVEFNVGNTLTISVGNRYVRRVIS